MGGRAELLIGWGDTRSQPESIHLAWEKSRMEERRLIHLNGLLLHIVTTSTSECSVENWKICWVTGGIGQGNSVCLLQERPGS